MNTLLTLQDELARSEFAMLDALDKFPDTAFTAELREGKWSAAAVFEHLLRTEMVILQLMRGKVEAPAKRPAEAKAQHIQKVFEKQDREYEAFGPLIPTGEMAEKGVLRDGLVRARQALRAELEENDPAELLADYTHFYFGMLSREEWAWFNVHHADRHLAQVTRLLEV